MNQRSRSNKTFAIISLYFEIYNRLPKNVWAMKIATLSKTVTLFSYSISVNPVINLTHVGIHVCNTVIRVRAAKNPVSELMNGVYFL